MGEYEKTPEFQEKISSIDITFTPGDLARLRDAGELSDKRVVVVDVLRATSTIIAALQNGACEVIPVATVETARALKDSLSDRALLCGERGGTIVSGFELGNSPREYTRERVEGKTIILTTSHGAQTIDAAHGSQEIIIASSVNAAAVGRYVRSHGGKVVLAASGSVFTKETGEKVEHPGGREDVTIGCGLVLNELAADELAYAKPWIKNLARVSAAYRAAGPEKVRRGLLDSRWGRELVKQDKRETATARQDDIEWIARHTNAIPIVPVVDKDGAIRIKASYD